MNDPIDLVWLREVHVGANAPAFASAEVTGNEDCPDNVVLYASADPTIFDTPVATYRRDGKSGDLVRIP